MGHYTNKCPEKENNQGERRTTLFQEDNDDESVKEFIGEEGATLMMKRTLIQAPMLVEPPQRKTLFRTNCKSHGKECKVVIDSSSTENIVSKETVDKLNLERIPHPNPSHVSWLTKG